MQTNCASAINGFESMQLLINDARHVLSLRFCVCVHLFVWMQKDCPKMNISKFITFRSLISVTLNGQFSTMMNKRIFYVWQLYLAVWEVSVESFWSCNWNVIAFVDMINVMSFMKLPNHLFVIWPIMMGTMLTVKKPINDLLHPKTKWTKHF